MNTPLTKVRGKSVAQVAAQKMVATSESSARVPLLACCKSLDIDPRFGLYRAERARPTDGGLSIAAKQSFKTSVGTSFDLSDAVRSKWHEWLRMSRMQARSAVSA